MTDDVSEVLIVTLVCLGAKEALSKKVTTLDRLSVFVRTLSCSYYHFFHKRAR